MTNEKKDSRNLQKSAFSSSSNVIYLTDEKLKQLKSLLKEILGDLLEVFNKFDINYTLGGGSVLGAVRHNGFIPWDDDIDINIPRKDFNKLMEIFDNELGDKYYLCCPEKTKGYGLSQAQIKKKNTLYKSFNELDMNDNICGIGVDLFVIENTYDSKFLRKLHGILCLAWGYALTCRKTAKGITYIKKYINSKDKLFRKKAFIGKLLSFMSLDFITRQTIKCYSMCKNNKSKYVTIPTGRKHYFGEMSERENMCKTISHVFEEFNVKIPYNYTEYLTRLYGKTYMQVPEEKDQEKHPLMEIDFGGNN